MKKSIKLILATVMILLAIITGAVAMVLNKNNYKAGDSSSLTVQHKIIEAQRNGQRIVLNSREINDVLAKVFHEERKKGNLKNISVPEVYLKDDLVGIKFPTNFLGLKTIVTTEGKVDYDGNNIDFKAENFKVGKVPFPKSMLFGKVTSNDYLNIEDNVIKIDKNKIPFSIKSLDVKDGKLTANLNKAKLKLL